MAHHGSSELPTELAAAFNRKTVADLEARLGEQLGATGKFPLGKIAPSDEGEIRLAVGQRDGKVVIDFGTPTAWIGMTAEQAEGFGDLLIQHAREIRLRG